MTAIRSSQPILNKLLMLAASALLSAGLQFASTPASADAVELPTANCGLGPLNNCLVFDQFTAYSLPLLQEYQSGSYPLSPSLAGLNLVAKPSEALLFVVNTAGGGGTADQGNNTLIDNPYDARTGAGNDNLQLLMVSSTFGGQFEVPSDPAGGPGANDNLRQGATTPVSTNVANATTFKTTQADLNANDYNAPCDGSGASSLNGCLPLWDADLAAVRDVLGTSDLLFFFQNNETGDSGELAGQDLVGWFTACVTDLDKALNDPTRTTCFEFSGSGTPPGFFDTQTAGVDDILPTAGDLWAHVHSDICVASGTNGGATFDGQVVPGKCQDLGFTGNTVNQSLGANEGTFALFNQQLSNLVKTTKNGVLTIDGRLAHLNDGGDLFWIGPGRVPVPGTVSLAGLGFALLGLMGLRRRRIAR